MLSTLSTLAQTSAAKTLTGPQSLAIAFGIVFAAAFLALLTGPVRRNTAMLATCIVILTVGIVGLGIAGTMYFLLQYSN